MILAIAMALTTFIVYDATVVAVAVFI